MLQKFFKMIQSHKIMVGLVIIILVVAGYFGYKKINGKENSVRYVTQAVEKGTLISSISGTGQVSASNQVDIKPKVSGDVVYIGVKNDQEVEAGTLLVQIDSRDAQRAVRDAATALETAKLELEELLQPVDAYSLMQTESSLTQAKDSLTKLKLTQERNYQNTREAIQKAKDDLKKAYEDGFNSVANTFLDLPTLMAGLEDILYGNTINPKQDNILAYSDMVKDYDEDVLQYKDETVESYSLARKEYGQNFQEYKAVSRYSATATIEALINKTYETNRDIAEAIKDANNLIDFVRDTSTRYKLSVPAIVSTHQSSLQTYTSKTNSFLSTLLSVQRTIEDNKTSKLDAEQDLKELDQNNPLDLAAAERSVKEKEESLVKLKAGPDELDIRAKKITIQQKKDALLTAQQNLADHYIRSPFAGIVVDLNVKKGESVSSNTIATLITKQKIAEVTLNEVDVAQVKTGQKATLEFDAVADLSLTGEVVEVDTLGTVNQGVVSYGVKIAFDLQDGRVKPGMSVSSSITIEVKPDVLMVPLAAVKTVGQESYVEVLVDVQPQRKIVTTGSSNDTMMEIVDGLKEGEQIISQTVSNTTSASASSSQNRQQPGFGGEFRMLR